MVPMGRPDIFDDVKITLCVRYKQFRVLGLRKALGDFENALDAERVGLGQQFPRSLFVLSVRYCCPTRCRTSLARVGGISFQLGVDLGVSCPAARHEPTKQSPAKFCIDDESRDHDAGAQ